MIFESPDGGKTVYRRVSVSQCRELHWVSDEKKAEIEREDENFLWQNILDAAKRNPALKDALDRARVIYELSK